MAYETFSDANNQQSIQPGQSDQTEAAYPSTTLSASSSKPGSTQAAAGWLGGWRGLAIGLGLGVIITAVSTHFTAAPSHLNSPPTQSAPAASQSVSVAPAELTAVTQTIDATGTVAAFDLLPILAQASGLQIQQVRVEEGQTVQAGQVLAVLDSSVLQAQLAQAQADVTSAQAVVRQRQAAYNQQKATLTEAESNLRRYQDLARAGAVSQKDLVSYQTAAQTAREALGVAQANIVGAEADVQSKVAQVQKLQTQIGQTVVRAPANGVIAERIARVGNVTGTDKLFSIIRDNSLELQAKVPETELPQIRIGAAARITSDADKRINLQGRVRDISPLEDPQTRQATVKISLPASPYLRSGAFLRTAIAVQTAQALTVPAESVQPQTDGGSIVYVIEGADTVRARSVEVGTRQAIADPTKARVAIQRGLQPGERVVVAGAGYVKDGDRVTIVQQ